MKLTPDEVEYYAELLSTAFSHDPYTEFMYRGLERVHYLTTQLHKAEIMELMKDNMIFPLEHKGIRVSCRSRDVGRLRLFWRFYHVSKHLLAVATPQEQAILRENTKKVRKVDNNNWYKKYTGTRDYYYILYLAIAQDSRGKGVFRELVTPALEYCEQEGIPAVLETHNPNNVPIYEHFGFEVVHVFEHKDVPFKQYCMAKRAPN